MKKFVFILLLFFIFLALPEAEERPWMIWAAIGGGVIAEHNELFSPLLYTGGDFYFETGYALNTAHLSWPGSFSFSSGRMKNHDQSYSGGELKTNTCRFGTGLFYSFNIPSIQTRFSFGPSLEAFVRWGPFTVSGSGNSEFSWFLAGSLGPGIGLENTLLSRFTFRLFFSMIFVSWALFPEWGMLPGGFPDDISSFPPQSGDLGDLLSTGQFVFFPRYQMYTLKLSCSFRISDHWELVGIYTLSADAFDSPQLSGRIRNLLTFGVEIDLGKGKNNE